MVKSKSREASRYKKQLKKEVIYIADLVCAPISHGVHANTFSLAVTVKILLKKEIKE